MLALGNGLRPDVWPRFKARFGIERIAELYASTEGNANLANTEGKEGAVGFISPLLAPVYPVRLVRLADSSAAGGEIARGPNGLALLCGGGEAGELLGLVNQRDAARNFAGYTDAAATRRKLVRDVLKRGDCWFRTGDLMRTDGEGFVYFVDRLGDTFRYKGENVSTAEVAAAIGAIGPLRLAQCVVYGVRLPQVWTARPARHGTCTAHPLHAQCTHVHCMRTARMCTACASPGGRPGRHGGTARRGGCTAPEHGDALRGDGGAAAALRTAPLRAPAKFRRRDCHHHHLQAAHGRAAG